MPNSSTDWRALLTSRGIDPNVAVPEDEPFDPIAWRKEHYRAMLAVDIPPTFQHARPDHPGVQLWIRRLLADPADAPWLLLEGNTGTGKTHQAYGCLRHLAGAAAAANRRFRWKVVTHPNLNAELRPKPDRSDAYALDPYLDADLLVLDDLAAGKISEFAGDNIERLVDHRWKMRLTTIYTTNADADTIEATCGARVLSRLGEAVRVELTGADRRFT